MFQMHAERRHNRQAGCFESHNPVSNSLISVSDLRKPVLLMVNLDHDWDQSIHFIHCRFFESNSDKILKTWILFSFSLLHIPHDNDGRLSWASAPWHWCRLELIVLFKHLCLVAIEPALFQSCACKKAQYSGTTLYPFLFCILRNPSSLRFELILLKYNLKASLLVMISIANYQQIRVLPWTRNH